MAGFSFKTNYIVYAKPEEVFEALTDTGIIAAWGGGMAVVGKVGEPFEMFDGWVKGEVSAYNPGKELAYTWKPDEWHKNTQASVVQIHFMKHAAGTELLLDHSNFPDEEEASKHGNGWIDYVFDPLNDYFTGGLIAADEEESTAE